MMAVSDTRSYQIILWLWLTDNMKSYTQANPEFPVGQIVEI